MLSIKQSISSFFYPQNKIDDEIEKIFFYYDFYTSNFSRIYTFAFILKIGLLGILIIDSIKFFNSELKGVSFELAVTHVIFFIICIFFIISSKYIKKKVKSLTLYRVYLWFVIILIFGIVIWTSLIDQKINGQITVLIMGFFGVSILFYIIPLDGLIIYTISILLFLLLLPMYQNKLEIIQAHYINIPILGVLSFFVSYYFFKGKVLDYIKNQKIQKAIAEYDELVKKILPDAVSFKLRKEEKYISEVNLATIVFIDFVSFSKIMNETNTEIVLKVLDELFEAFDRIILKYRLEKIKTIGDGYMYAGGLFSNISQLKECVDSALEILHFIESKKEELFSRTGYEWQIRMGIDCGEVVTGVIGNWRFTFDIWGNTVNIASRLVSECEPNHINVSKNVFDKIWMYSEFQFKPRGYQTIKNLGTIEMYYVYQKKSY